MKAFEVLIAEIFAKAHFFTGIVIEIEFFFCIIIVNYRDKKQKVFLWCLNVILVSKSLPVSVFAVFDCSAFVAK